MTQLATSPIGYGIPDFASGAFNDARRREELRLEIEATIRRFEPRFLSVRVNLIDAQDRLETTLRLRIEAVLHAEPAPESVTFDTLVDPTTDESWCGPAMWSEQKVPHGGHGEPRSATEEDRICASRGAP